MSEQQEARHCVTIAEFIETNHKLITTLGFFTALSALAANLPLKALGFLLSFFTTAAGLLIWIELMEKFPARQSMDPLLSSFRWVLSCIPLTLCIYWVLRFLVIWDIVAFWLIFLTSTYVSFKVFFVFAKVFPRVRKFAKPLLLIKPAWLSFLLGLSVFTVISWLFASWITPKARTLWLKARVEVEKVNVETVRTESAAESSK